jgi:Zn-dependent peptidase ImmA (M78 family)/DNA-binding XRE family transcriptional regulator
MHAERVIASNVVRLRNDREWSQAELAKRADLSRVAIGKIERAETQPRERSVSKLAHALDVPLRELLTEVRQLRTVRFRAAKRVNTREQILSEVSRWLDDYNALEDVLQQRASFAFRDLVGDSAPPDKLAKKARDLIELGPREPIRDICGLLEDHGVKVLLLEKKSDSFFGLSVAEDEGGPAIVVNTWDRISVERWIFTAAHELGHLLLHPAAYDLSKRDESDSEEREADKFASHLLMPEEAFEKEWEEGRGLDFISRVFKIKRMFRVSYKTVLYRLVESSRADRTIRQKWNGVYKATFKTALKHKDEPEGLAQSEFRLKWNRAGEPEALSKSDFEQDRLLRLIRLGLEAGDISRGRAGEILGKTRAEMRELTASWVN